MEFTGQLRGLTKDWESGEWRVSFSVTETDALEAANELKDSLLVVTAKKYRKKRSKDANAMLWACIADIAKSTSQDKWEVYLQLLKRYGKCTSISIRADALEAFKATWREIEVVGEFEEYGQKMFSVLCYFGSHLYNSEEFSRLLEGTIEEMKEIGLQPPPSKEMRRALELWGQR